MWEEWRNCWLLEDPPTRNFYHSLLNVTKPIERDTARQRHWLARFRRRSIVVSKATRMVDASIALFARLAGNSRIGDLLSMLA